MKKFKEIFAGFGAKSADQHSHQHGDETHSHSGYQCPMKCEGNKTYEAPGNCPVCNMKLIPVGTKNQSSHNHNHHGCC